VGRAPGCSNTCGAIPLSNNYQYTRLTHVTQLVYTVFARNFDSGARDGYTDVDEGRRTETPEVTESSGVVDRGPRKNSGVHRNVISKLENSRGGAYPETIRKLARALDVDPAELIKE